MRKILNVLVAVSSIAAGLALAPSSAHAQSASVALDCSGSDMCEVFVSNAGAQLPLHYAWAFNSSGTDAVFPQNCTDKTTCTFYCPKRPGRIQASVTVTDANFQFVGSASSMAECTAEPI